MSLALLFIFVALLFLLIRIEINYNIPYSIWLVLPFSLIIASRSVMVPDTENYIFFFNNLSFRIDDFNNSGFEYGFQVFSKFVKYLTGSNVELYFFVITVVNLVIVAFSIKRINRIFNIDNVSSSGVILEKKYLFIPISLYIAFYGIYLNAVVLRVGIAFSLILLATTIAIKSKLGIIDCCLLFVILLASTFFHATSILGIVIVLILIFSKQYTKLLYLWIWFFIGMLYFSNMSSWLSLIFFKYFTTLSALSALSLKLSNYENSVLSNTGGISIKFIFYWVALLFMIIRGRNSHVFYKYLNVYTIGLLIFALFRPILLIERVTDFFIFYSFVVFYLFLINKEKLLFWCCYLLLFIPQIVFVLRITNREM